MCGTQITVEAILQKLLSAESKLKLKPTVGSLVFYFAFITVQEIYREKEDKIVIQPDAQPDSELYYRLQSLKQKIPMLMIAVSFVVYAFIQLVLRALKMLRGQ